MENFKLLVKTMHHLTKHFKEHAVLKGGIELALFSSPRSTNDLDFVFVPFKSKKDIVAEIKRCLESMGENTKVKPKLSSKNVKFFVTHDHEEIEVEVNVATEVESIPMNTVVLAKQFNMAPQVIRVMKPEVALAHKIAAWNERRLIRDVYDIYFWFGIQKVFPDIKVLLSRLKHIESRIPKLRNRKSMTMQQLGNELRDFCMNLTQTDIDHELAGVPENERHHLNAILKSQMNLLINHLCLSAKCI